MAGTCCISLYAAQAMGVTAGESAPNFNVTSGSGEVLTLDMLKGKTAVIFYETKDTAEKNRALKDRLNTFYDLMPSDAQNKVVRIVIIRCSAFMPTVWRRNLRENSKKESITIYGDWDGLMEKNYAMRPNDSNLIVIDSFGVIRYAASGIVPAEGFDAVKKIIKENSRYMVAIAKSPS